MRARHKATDSVADNNVWYDVFADVTFDTYFAPFTQQQGRSFISHYRQRYCSAPDPSEDDITAMKALETTIDELMTRINTSGSFVRLNTRSPKDAIALDSDKFQEVTKLYTLNEQIQLFFDLSMGSLCVHTGKEAIDLLLSSERIFVDIIQAFDANEDQKQTPNITTTTTTTTTNNNNNPKVWLWDLEICVRQWENNLREDLEFRGFVVNYELIAVSQYNTYVNYSHMVAHKSLIEMKLREFYEKEVKYRLQTLNMPDTVIDFAILPDCAPLNSATAATTTAAANSSTAIAAIASTNGATTATTTTATTTATGPYSFSPRYPFTAHSLASGPVVVIELNPYNKRTGGGLFTWKDEYVLDVECDGQFEFRVMACDDGGGGGGGGGGSGDDVVDSDDNASATTTTTTTAPVSTPAGNNDINTNSSKGQQQQDTKNHSHGIMFEILLGEADLAYKRKCKEAERQRDLEETQKNDGLKKCVVS